ncbi:MAG TPA: TIR domain-containing protein [Pyrinomonadaceae bacterium]|nr:TIR domain-containing protein [Pyrinomonadaceae bacterium]
MSNIFISYTHLDVKWAEWIAWQLELDGHLTVLQAWDFLPGDNFVVGMQAAVVESDFTIAVLSDEYQQAPFSQAEWAAAFASDPVGNLSKLVPVRIKPCEPKGLLAQIVYIDIAGYLEDAARQRLLRGVRAVAEAGYYGRNKNASNLFSKGYFSDRVRPLRPTTAPVYPDLIEVVDAIHRKVDQYTCKDDGKKSRKELLSEIKSSVSNLPALNVYSIDFPWPQLDAEMKLLLRKQDGDKFLRTDLDAIVKSEYVRTKGKGLKLSLILLDIDDLTIISKQFGAEAGSQVLVEIMDIIRKIAQGHKVGRCGEDTYYILLPNHSTNQAITLARRLCKLVHIHSWSAIASNLSVTISAGVVRLKRSEPAIDLVIRAAKGFKIAKQEGGNRVEVGPIELERAESRELRKHYS